MSTSDDFELPGGENYDKQWQALAGWFLGPRAENRNVFNGLMMKALNWHENRREEFFPADPSYFTSEFRNSTAAQSEYKDLETKMAEMHTQLNKSIPFFSTRYQGHMTWDTTMPSLLGYVSGLLWNQNNVDSTASPVTTQFEVEVGQQLCALMRFDTVKNTPWGHLTGCGSVANLESMWAARNTKLHPLALKNAICDHTTDYPRLAIGMDYPVDVPAFGKGNTPLASCTNWELLNLRIDFICEMTDKVVEYIVANTSDKGGMTKDEFKAAVKSDVDTTLALESCVQIGLPEFYRKHNIGEPSEVSPNPRRYPRVYSAGTNHYSWPKSATVLGIGDSQVIPITINSRARQNMDYLKEQLDYAITHQIPVFMVVAVIGSTEESSVDDLDQILKFKNDYEVLGLTFSVHADSAWGGYLNTMTHDAKDTNVIPNQIGVHDFVPTIPLSDYVRRQYLKLALADTITIDPHKAGFCPYPAGALLYRNGTMKGFITLAAPEVFHSPDDLNVGIYGLEGSKPGAAACGVLLSHRVIGLDSNGYGRILGQCQFGSKLFYCMWETIARAKDPFICQNLIAPILSELNATEAFQPPHEFKSIAQVHEYIADHILNKSNEIINLNENNEITFLGVVGPDALINQFTVNCIDPATNKGQTNIELVNDLQDLIFNELTSSVGEDTKRVKMFLTTSKLAQKNYGDALIQLKERLNLPIDDGKDLAFLRNTCMEPYQASEAYVVKLGELFRNCVLSCIGALDVKYNTDHHSYGDPLDIHSFTVVNKMRDGKIFLDFVPTFTKKGAQYQVVFRVNVDAESQSALEGMQADAAAGGYTLFADTPANTKLFNFVKDKPTDIRNVTITKGFKGEVKGTIKFTVDEVWEYRHFELDDYAKYNDRQEYFLFGDEQEVFMSHVINGVNPDFYQVVKLAEYPIDVLPELVNLGLIVEVRDLDGEPLIVGDVVEDPLKGENYAADYRGKEYAASSTSLVIGDKIHFDASHLNGTAEPKKSKKGKHAKRHKGKHNRNHHGKHRR